MIDVLIPQSECFSYCANATAKIAQTNEYLGYLIAILAIVIGIMFYVIMSLRKEYKKLSIKIIEVKYEHQRKDDSLGSLENTKREGMSELQEEKRSDKPNTSN